MSTRSSATAWRSRSPWWRLACTYTAWWGRRWQLSISLVLVANALIWSVDRVALPASAPTDWGYAGMMVILAFIYVLSRLQFVYAAVVGAVSIVIYDVLTIAFASDTNTQFLVANYFLVTFAFVGMAASYGLDRSARLLFLRERQLDAARVRADELLHNTLPAAIVERLKARGSEPGVELLADGHDQVTVVFADLVSFTEHAERIAPAPLVAVLDEVFTMFDDLAQRVGMDIWRWRVRPSRVPITRRPPQRWPWRSARAWPRPGGRPVNRSRSVSASPPARWWPG